jgi:hypothetical protein
MKTECALASKENNFIDFDHEGLISKELSQEGPSQPLPTSMGMETMIFWCQRQFRKNLFK